MRHQKLITTTSVSRRMSHVHLKRGKSEVLLSKALWNRGYRYRLNYKKLPGSPDIAITRYKIAIFVDGEFWHGQDWEVRKTRLKSNREYWINKIEENMSRDERNDKQLRLMGWIPLHFWENELLKSLSSCLAVVDYTRDEFINKN